MRRLVLKRVSCIEGDSDGRFRACKLGNGDIVWNWKSCGSTMMKRNDWGTDA